MRISDFPSDSNRCLLTGYIVMRNSILLSYWDYSGLAPFSVEYFPKRHD